MALVTVFSALVTTGAGELVAQAAAEPRFVAHCNMYPVESNPATLVGQVKTTFVPECSILSCGRNERLKTVPLPELPPAEAVP
jgi:hypothetical protein